MQRMTRRLAAAFCLFATLLMQGCAVDVATAAAGDERRPFDESADAMQEVDAALLAAKATGKLPLLVLGGNWCHDSRGLAEKFADEPLKTLVEAKYLPVWVDVGHRDRNLNVARRFGVNELIGTPTVIVLSPEGRLLNADSVHDWRTADSRTLEVAISYFESFAGGAIITLP